jgi:hypothetical protein
LGTKGQHATPRPPKPLSGTLLSLDWYLGTDVSEHPVDPIFKGLTLDDLPLFNITAERIIQEFLFDLLCNIDELQ